MCNNAVVLSSSSNTTLFQGIGNSHHQLKITGSGAKHIKEIVVYAPLLNE
jgi:hypothetical protein